MFFLFTFIIITVFGFISLMVIPLDLVLLLVVIYAVSSSTLNSFLFAFLSGIFLDLLKGNYLGKSSIIYLLICFLVTRYRVKFKQTRAFYLLPFTFIIVSLLNYYRRGNFFWLQAFILGILILPLNFIILMIKEKTQSKKKRLAL